MGLFRRSPKPSEADRRPKPEPESHFDAQERQWREGIARHGWLVIDVPPGDDTGDEVGAPGFQFTAGLTERELPEMIVYGLAPEVGMHVLNDVAERLLAGESFDNGQVIPGLLEGDFSTQLWDVTWLQDPLGAAFALYGADRVRVRQLVVPDTQNRLPWEDDYSHPDLQPLLFTAPNGVGPRRAGAEGVDHDDVPEGWDLPQDPHLGVFTTTYVTEGALPALYVVHDHDGEWQVLDGVHEPVLDVVHRTCLHHLISADESLVEILRSLPVGHEAERASSSAAWVTQPAQEE